MVIKITNQDLITRFLDFIRDLTPQDNIAILHDMDPDGSCAALILKKGLNTLGIEPKLIHHIFENKEKTYFPENLRKEIKKLKINKIICLDKPIETSFPNDLDYLNTFETSVIIDHHQFDKDCNSEKIILIKPTLFCEGIEPVKYCTTKLVYDLVTRLVDVSDYDWACSIAIIADYAYVAWKDFVESTMKKHKVMKVDDVFENEFGKMAMLINNGNALGEEDFKAVVPALDSVKDFRELNSKLEKFSKITDEIYDYVENYKKYSEILEDKELIFFHLPSKHRIGSPISSILSKKFKDTLIVIRKEKENINVSARRQDQKYDMAKMLKTLCAEFGGQGGGHIPAAGGSIPLDKWEDFKIELIKRIGEFRTTK